VAAASSVNADGRGGGGSDVVAAADAVGAVAAVGAGADAGAAADAGAGGGEESQANASVAQEWSIEEAALLYARTLLAREGDGDDGDGAMASDDGSEGSQGGEGEGEGHVDDVHDDEDDDDDGGVEEGDEDAAASGSEGGAVVLSGVGQRHSGDAAGDSDGEDGLGGDSWML